MNEEKRRKKEWRWMFELISITNKNYITGKNDYCTIPVEAIWMEHIQLRSGEMIIQIISDVMNKDSHYSVWNEWNVTFWKRKENVTSSFETNQSLQSNHTTHTHKHTTFIPSAWQIVFNNMHEIVHFTN